MSQQEQSIADRRSVVVDEIDNLAANMLAGVLSLTLVNLFSEREAENARSEAKLAEQAITKPSATILPHPALLRLFEEKVGKLCEPLNDNRPRRSGGDPVDAMESVPIYPEGEHGPEADVIARVWHLMTRATNDNAALGGGVLRSVTVVAGTRTGRCHTSPMIGIQSQKSRAPAARQPSSIRIC